MHQCILCVVLRPVGGALAVFARTQHKATPESPRPRLLALTAQSILRMHGPLAVDTPLGDDAPDTLLETAVRVGVALEYVQDHPRLRTALEEAIRRRKVLVEVFLFGCRKSSGSTYLWRIGSQHLMAGLRKAVAEYLGATMHVEELRRMRGVCAAVLETEAGAT